MKIDVWIAENFMHVSAEICWNKYGDECEIENKIYWFLDIDVAGGAGGVEPSSRQEQPRSRVGRWITLLFSYDM